MSVLKSLNFISPTEEAKTPLDRARSKLIDNLHQQIALIEDRQQFKVRRQWKLVDGEKQLIEKKIPIRPWWEERSNGEIYLRLRNGVRILELQAGKPTIRIETTARLTETVQNLIQATQIGDLDAFLAPLNNAKRRGRTKT
jgi:hypothetical protein